MNFGNFINTKMPLEPTSEQKCQAKIYILSQQVSPWGPKENNLSIFKYLHGNKNLATHTSAVEARMWMLKCESMTMLPMVSLQEHAHLAFATLQ